LAYITRNIDTPDSFESVMMCARNHGAGRHLSWQKGWGGLFRALISRMAIGLMALTVAACGLVPASSPAAARAPDPPSLATIRAALTVDQSQADTDLTNVTTDIGSGNADPASERCYVLANNVRYDVDQRLNRGARASTSSDAATLQAQFDAKWQELVNLQQYNLDFGNNGVAPFGGNWATTAISQMMTALTTTATAANASIALVNNDVAAGYQQYRSAWGQWGCPASQLLQAPAQVALVKVKGLPAA
jgi:hypothetical protein